MSIMPNYAQANINQLKNIMQYNTRNIAAPSSQSYSNTRPEKTDVDLLNINELICHRNFTFKPIEPLDQMDFNNYVGPTPESNWVIPGCLLVGAYPASRDDDETFQLLTSILKLGVTKFVCLQEEYRSNGVTEVMWRHGNALRPYFDDVKIIVKNKNKFQIFNEKNLSEGIKVVDESHLSFVHFPIRDCGISDDDRVFDLAKSLVKAISQGEVLYMHCWGGHGRTGTLVSIMLSIMYGLDAKQSMMRCQYAHDMRQYPVDVGSPQTQSQRDQVVRVTKKIHALINQMEINKKFIALSTESDEKRGLFKSEFSKSISSYTTIESNSLDDTIVDYGSELSLIDENKDRGVSVETIETNEYQDDLSVSSSNIPNETENLSITDDDIKTVQSSISVLPEIIIQKSINNVDEISPVYVKYSTEFNNSIQKSISTLEFHHAIQNNNNDRNIYEAHPPSSEVPSSTPCRSFRPVIRRSSIISGDNNVIIVKRRDRSYSDLDYIEKKSFQTFSRDEAYSHNTETLVQ